MSMWTPERQAELRRLWAENWSACRIADLFGCSRESVSHAARLLKLPQRSKGELNRATLTPAWFWRACLGCGGNFKCKDRRKHRLCENCRRSVADRVDVHSLAGVSLRG